MHWPGIEPGPPAWQASILPLNHQCLYATLLHLNIICFLLLRTILKEYFLNESKDNSQEETSLVPSFWRSSFKANVQGKEIHSNNLSAVNSPQSFDGHKSNEDTSQIEFTLTGLNENEKGVEEPDEKTSSLSLAERFRRKLKIYWKRYECFTNSPKTHFVYDTLFYTIFLLIFSYMILCDFKYYGEEISFSNETSPNVTVGTNSTEEAIFTHSNSLSAIKINKVVQGPAPIEYLMVFWIISFLLEEINQVFIWLVCEFYLIC